ncbi:hypothetical protein [Erwinia tasmaniensis]|uniref:Uncharacterized protein n=1 Tax=Erwinia tasmaniensis (strain DSM 17950 / CFBP 7177 / CIP 109463 / NCPPB 4357 / Et1/99) TaxID=465817 RepID=B2VBF4_ERWT9|nr:hypothetical protein [Erwinia tasmaniensis]CAO97466.1 Conserved hypothetical protein [Erwinia tasmaniensis Et1/99]
MREQTRSYTTAQPRLTLAHLKAIRQRFSKGAKALQLATRAGEMRFHLGGSSYTATIGGRVLPLRTTSTRAGYGVRHWYLCPHCHNRAAVLFIGKRDLACRKCWGLHYASQSEDRLARMRRSLFKQRAAIWGDYAPAYSLFNDCALFPKPAGMRWETFSRKVLHLQRSEQAYYRAFSPVVDKIMGAVERRTGAAGAG